jgi:hypothetical protein
LSVKPAPFDSGSFSPRPTAKDGFFAMIYQQDFDILPPDFIFAVFADSTKSCFVGAPLLPTLRIFSPEPSAIRCLFALMLA